MNGCIWRYNKVRLYIEFPDLFIGTMSKIGTVTNPDIGVFAITENGFTKAYSCIGIGLRTLNIDVRFSAPSFSPYDYLLLRMHVSQPRVHRIYWIRCADHHPVEIFRCPDLLIIVVPLGRDDNIVDIIIIEMSSSSICYVEVTVKVHN